MQVWERLESLFPDDARVQEQIAVKGCPPSPNSMLKALHKAGIDAEQLKQPSDAVALIPAEANAPSIKSPV